MCKNCAKICNFTGIEKISLGYVFYLCKFEFSAIFRNEVKILTLLDGV